MSTMTIDLHLFEALTEIGIKPDAAKRVERQVELAIAQGQQAVRAEIREQQTSLMTKQDGLALKIEFKADIAEVKADIAELRDEMRKGFNDITWRLVTFVVAANGLTLAAFKYLG